MNVGLDFNVTGDDGVAGPPELGDFLNNLQAALTGSAEATLPVYFPSDSEYLGDIVFDAGLTLDGSANCDANVNDTGCRTSRTSISLPSTRSRASR